MTLPPMKFIIEIDNPIGYVSELTAEKLEMIIRHYIMQYGYNRPKVTVIENDDYIQQEVVE